MSLQPPPAPESVAPPMPSPTTILEARELTRQFRLPGETVEAVRGVSLHVLAGEFVALMGPSGSGKSTLLQLLGGLDRPTSGEVLLEGAPIGRLSDDEATRLRRERTGFVFQSFNLVPLLNVVENVGLPFTIAGLDPRSGELAARVRDAIASVELTGKERHRPDQLSSGEQQRVAVARAIVPCPSSSCRRATGNSTSRPVRISTPCGALRDRGQRWSRSPTIKARPTPDRGLSWADGRIRTRSPGPREDHAPRRSSRGLARWAVAAVMRGLSVPWRSSSRGRRARCSGRSAIAIGVGCWSRRCGQRRLAARSIGRSRPLAGRADLRSPRSRSPDCGDTLAASTACPASRSPPRIERAPTSRPDGGPASTEPSRVASIRPANRGCATWSSSLDPASTADGHWRSSPTPGRGRGLELAASSASRRGCPVGGASSVLAARAALESGGGTGASARPRARVRCGPPPVSGARCDLAASPVVLAAAPTPTPVVRPGGRALTAEPYLLSVPRDVATTLRASSADVRAMMALLASITLFAAAFLILNTLAMTVVERIRELGLLRAAGAGRGQVVRVVVTQLAARHGRLVLGLASGGSSRTGSRRARPRAAW